MPFVAREPRRLVAAMHVVRVEVTAARMDAVIQENHAAVQDVATAVRPVVPRYRNAALAVLSAALKDLLVVRMARFAVPAVVCPPYPCACDCEISRKLVFRLSRRIILRRRRM